MVSWGPAVLMRYFLVVMVMLPCKEAVNYNEINHDEEPRYSYAEEDKGGRLVGDVQNWATLIQNYILQVNKPL